MHAQCDVESSARQFASQAAVGAAAVRFAEGDKLHVRYVAHQPRLGPADNPRDAGVGPVVLESANDGKRVTRVADCRESYDANLFGRSVCEQLRQVDNEGRIR